MHTREIPERDVLKKCAAPALLAGYDADSAGGREGGGPAPSEGGTAQSGAVPATHAKDPQRARAALSLYHCEPV